MKRNLWIAAAVLVLLVVSPALAAGGEGFTPGQAVYAEWTPNGWYHGKITQTCDAGWHILFDDGDQKCCAPAQIVKDVVPNASKVKVGSNVLALWSNGKFYPGKVTAIAAGVYSIAFADGDKGTANLSQIRLR